MDITNVPEQVASGRSMAYPRKRRRMAGDVRISLPPRPCTAWSRFVIMLAPWAVAAAGAPTPARA